MSREEGEGNEGKRSAINKFESPFGDGAFQFKAFVFLRLLCGLRGTADKSYRMVPAKFAPVAISLLMMALALRLEAAPATPPPAEPKPTAPSGTARPDSYGTTPSAPTISPASGGSQR